MSNTSSEQNDAYYKYKTNKDKYNVMLDRYDKNITIATNVPLYGGKEFQHSSHLQVGCGNDELDALINKSNKNIVDFKNIEKIINNLQGDDKKIYKYKFLLCVIDRVNSIADNKIQTNDILYIDSLFNDLFNRDHVYGSTADTQYLMKKFMDNYRIYYKQIAKLINTGIFDTTNSEKQCITSLMDSYIEKYIDIEYNMYRMIPYEEYRLRDIDTYIYIVN